VSNQKEKEIISFAQTFRKQGPATLHYLLVAVLIWLFGVLVFLPLANSINWQTSVLCSAIVFGAFTVFVYRAMSGCKNLIDAFSPLPAKKYGGKWGMDQKDALLVFRYGFYIAFGVIIYAFYFPLLATFHAALAGIVLILVLVWVFFLLLRIAPILFSRFVEKLGQ
jgi:hypothetical protein